MLLILKIQSKGEQERCPGQLLGSLKEEDRRGEGLHQGQNISPQCEKSHGQHRELKCSDSTARVLCPI